MINSYQRGILLSSNSVLIMLHNVGGFVMWEFSVRVLLWVWVYIYQASCERALCSNECHLSRVSCFHKHDDITFLLYILWRQYWLTLLQVYLYPMMDNGTFVPLDQEVGGAFVNIERLLGLAISWWPAELCNVRLQLSWRGLNVTIRSRSAPPPRIIHQGLPIGVLVDVNKTPRRRQSVCPGTPVPAIKLFKLEKQILKLMFSSGFTQKLKS